MSRTKGQIEAQICEAVTRFEKEYMGRGPLEIKADHLSYDSISDTALNGRLGSWLGDWTPHRPIA